MISIITPVWNRSDLTGQYLYTHNIHYPTDEGIEWIIIDNGSADGTDNILTYWQDIIGPRLRVIVNDQNMGFAYACNQGAELAEGNILLFLNNDVIVKGDYISMIEKEMAAHLRSLVGAQYIDVDTGWNVFDGRPIPYLVGWCLAIRRGAFRILGGFDEQYTPAYYEDIDLCYNAYSQGYTLRPVNLPLQHLGEQTGPQLTGRRQITETNRAKFARKWGLSYELK